MVTIDTQDTELFMHDFATAYKQQFWIGLYSVLVGNYEPLHAKRSPFKGFVE